mgnify:CR=1 FL=1
MIESSGVQIVYIVETKKEVFWSKTKLDAQFKHIEFLYKDQARFKEMTEEAFKKYTEKLSKKVIELTR